MSHVFISYSKRNIDYAQRLKDKLLAEGFNVWIDEVIEPGEDWWRNIRQAIRDCAVFVLIMTPEAEISHWVGLELLHALEYKKPLYPLLRDGDTNLLNSDTWSRIANIQYTNVRHGNLPPDGFFNKLASKAPRIQTAVVLTPPQPPPPVGTRRASSADAAQPASSPSPQPPPAVGTPFLASAAIPS